MFTRKNTKHLKIFVLEDKNNFTQKKMKKKKKDNRRRRRRGREEEEKCHGKIPILTNAAYQITDLRRLF